MTRTHRLITLLGGLGLLLAATVSTADPLQVDLRRTTSSGPVHQAPPTVLETSSGGGGPAPEGLHGGVATSPDWLVSTLTVLIYTVVGLVALAVLVAVVRSLLARIRDREQTPTPTGGHIRVADAVLADAEAQMAELRTGDATDSVVRCWVRLQTSLREAGVRDDPSRTPAEIVLLALSHDEVDGAALQRLATLYRQARFSEHHLTEDDREDAEGALARIHADLRRHGGSPSSPPRTAARAGGPPEAR